MSISSTSNTLSSPSSGSGSAGSTPQPSSIRATPSTSSSSSAASPALDCDQLLNGDGDEDDNIFRTKIASKSITVIKEEPVEETLRKTSITSNDNDKRSDNKSDIIKQTTLTTTSNKTNTTSLVRDSCHTEKIPLGAATTLSTTTTSQQRVTITSKRPLSGLESLTSTSTPPTILKKVAPIVQSPVAKSRDNVVVSSRTRTRGSQVGGSSGNASSQLANNRWKLGTKLETTCNILSKSSVAKSASRPADLVAASSSSLTTINTGASSSQVINFKTLPLLMHHNRHFQTSAATLTASGGGSGGSGANNPKSTGATSNPFSTSTSAIPLVSTLTPQIILSQIITANPTQRASAITSAQLDGLQFCLTSATTTATNTPANAANVIHVQSLANPVHANSTTTKKNSTSAAGGAPPQPTTSASPNKQRTSRENETKPKVKQSSQASNNTTPTKNNIDSSGVQGEGSPGNNIAAARLLDLGKKLLEATRQGELDQVRHLVEDSGAPFTSDWLGTTALHLAAQGGYMDIAEVLVRAGVNRDARTKLERTALHLAAQSGSLDIVDLLLTHGSDVNARDMLRMTPLHWAVERGHIYVAERLLLSGADVELSNKFLLTPLDIARELGSYEMIDLFKNWTGDTKDDQNMNAYDNEPDAMLNESHDFLEIDYHLALVDSATSAAAAAAAAAACNGRATGDEISDKSSGGAAAAAAASNSGLGEPCIDLVEFEWNKFDFDPELFLPSEESNEEEEEEEEEEEQKVDFLMKVVEDLKKENQLLRQKVEQLSTVDGE